MYKDYMYVFCYGLMSLHELMSHLMESIVYMQKKTSNDENDHGIGTQTATHKGSERQLPGKIENGVNPEAHDPPTA